MEDSTVSGYAVTNLLFAVAILTSSYNFFRAVSLDPGHVPFPANDGELKDVSSFFPHQYRTLLIGITDD